APCAHSRDPPRVDACTLPRRRSQDRLQGDSEGPVDREQATARGGSRRMTADYPMGTLYVELHYSAPPDLAPEYNGGRGRKVELFRDPPGVVAVVPQAATVEEAQDAARALLVRGFDAYGLPGDPPEPWLVKVIDRELMHPHDPGRTPRTGYLTTDHRSSSHTTRAT